MAVGWRRDYGRYQRYFLNVMLFYKKRPDLQAFLEILLSLGTITLFALMALRPTFLTIAQLLTEIENKKETISQMEEKVRNLNTAQSLFREEGQRISLLDTAVPKQVFPEQVVRQIEGLATREGATVVGISIGEVTLLGEKKATKEELNLEKLPEGAQGFSVSVSAKGGYQDLQAFANSIENLRRPIFIDSFSLSQVRSEEGSPSIVFLLTGRAIYEKP